jgi:hypothetical protein
MQEIRHYVKIALVTAALLLIIFQGISWWLTEPRPAIGFGGALTMLLLGLFTCTSHVALLFALHRYVPSLEKPGLHQLLWVFPVGFLAVLIADFLLDSFVHPQLSGTAVGIAVFGVYAELFRRIAGVPPWFARKNDNI